MEQKAWIIDEKTAKQYLTVEDAIDCVEKTWKWYGEGRVIMPNKITTDMSELGVAGWFNSMPAYIGPMDVAGIKVVGGRYGLGSKDTPPASAFAVFEELKKDEPKREFTIGIVDDVTNLSLPEAEDAPNTAAPGTIECKFWGLGGDGTVGANKNSIKIIGDHTDKYVQAYFQYDSKKTGGVTVSHLRFGDSPIRSPYYVTKADFVACHNPSYIVKGFKMVRDVKPGGTFLVNCQWSDEEFAEHMPAVAKRYIANNNVNVYLIDAIDLAAKVGMGKRTNTVLQSAFFALAKVLPAEDALQYMKDAATKSYMKKGQAIVDANHKAIDAGATAFRKFEVPADWATAEDAAPVELSEETKSAIAQQVKNLLEPIDRMDGDSLPVSAFVGCADGQFELGASAYEKRGVAVAVFHQAIHLIRRQDDAGLTVPQNIAAHAAPPLFPWFNYFILHENPRFVKPPQRVFHKILLFARKSFSRRDFVV
mgnify:CR=1 FL=1